jgi:hypothetical protein
VLCVPYCVLVAVCYYEGFAVSAVDVTWLSLNRYWLRVATVLTTSLLLSCLFCMAAILSFTLCYLMLSDGHNSRLRNTVHLCR